MKKKIAAATGILATLIPSSTAFAQVSIGTCPTGIGGTICNLQAGDFGKVVSNLITTLIIIAIIIAIIFLVWGGIKWILSGGDKAKVEAARNTIIGGIIGLVLVFLAYFIITIVAGLFGIDIHNLTIPNLLQ
jgi:hypothetical protein